MNHRPVSTCWPPKTWNWKSLACAFRKVGGGTSKRRLLRNTLRSLLLPPFNEAFSPFTVHVPEPTGQSDPGRAFAGVLALQPLRLSGTLHLGYLAGYSGLGPWARTFSTQQRVSTSWLWRNGVIRCLSFLISRMPVCAAKEILYWQLPGAGEDWVPSRCKALAIKLNGCFASGLLSCFPVCVRIG